MRIRTLLLLATATACMSFAPGDYLINGIYTATDHSEVYLVNLDSNDTIGVAAVSNGRFSLKGTIDRPAYVYLGQGRERVRFILEPGTVTVSIDERNESGTPLVDAYNDFHRRFYAFDALRQQERDALTARRSQLSDSLFNRQWTGIGDKYLRLQGQLADSVVRANGANLLGVLALDDVAVRDTALFSLLYHVLAPQMQSTAIIRKHVQSIRQQSLTAPGRMFTDYLIKGGNPDGSDVRLSDYVGRGKYILLDHWASWCGPCKKEMPYIKKVWQDFAGDRFDVVSIAVSDKRDATVKALQQLDMPWHQILDAQQTPSRLYQVTTIPHLILFAPDGTILHRGLRGEQIHATVSELLGDR